MRDTIRRVSQFNECEIAEEMWKRLVACFEKDRMGVTEQDNKDEQATAVALEEPREKQPEDRIQDQTRSIDMPIGIRSKTHTAKQTEHHNEYQVEHQHQLEIEHQINKKLEKSIKKQILKPPVEHIDARMCSDTEKSIKPVKKVRFEGKTTKTSFNPSETY